MKKISDIPKDMGTSMTYHRYILLENLLDNLDTNIFIEDYKPEGVEKYYYYLMEKVYEKFQDR